MGTRVLGTFPPVGDWLSWSSTGLLEVDLQYVTVSKITRTGVDWRYCTASTPQPCYLILLPFLDRFKIAK